MTLFGIWRAGRGRARRSTRGCPSRSSSASSPTSSPAAVVRPSNERGLARARRCCRAPGEPRQYDAEVALIMTTSGTTGPPKRVLLGHESVIASVDSALNKIRGGARRRSRRGSRPTRRAAPMPNLVPMPLALWSGIYNTLFASRVGAAVILLHPFDAARVRRRREALRAEVHGARAADDHDARRRSRRSPRSSPLRFVRSGTAPLSPSEARRFRDRFGVTVLNSYGQTELGGEIVGLERRRHAPLRRRQARLGGPTPRGHRGAHRARTTAPTPPSTSPGRSGPGRRS